MTFVSFQLHPASVYFQNRYPNLAQQRLGSYTNVKVRDRGGRHF